MKEERGKSNRHIFLSYAMADSEQAYKLQNLLSQQLNSKIFTTDSLSAGENWVPKLKRALSECDLFIVVLSPNSIGSKWVLYELGAAWGLGKPIIPVVTHPEILSNIPLVLRETKLVNFKDFENPEALYRIIKQSEEEATALQTSEKS
jgi:hypothetical protein